MDRASTGCWLVAHEATNPKTSAMMSDLQDPPANARWGSNESSGGNSGEQVNMTEEMLAKSRSTVVKVGLTNVEFPRRAGGASAD